MESNNLLTLRNWKHKKEWWGEKRFFFMKGGIWYVYFYMHKVLAHFIGKCIIGHNWNLYNQNKVDAFLPGITQYEY